MKSEEMVLALHRALGRIQVELTRGDVRKKKREEEIRHTLRAARVHEDFHSLRFRFPDHTSGSSSSSESDSFAVSRHLVEQDTTTVRLTDSLPMEE